LLRSGLIVLHGEASPEPNKLRAVEWHGHPARAKLPRGFEHLSRRGPLRMATIDQLKRLTIVALFSEDELVHKLVLKGGNALSLAHNVSSRASFDLDFSMEGAFEQSELERIRSRIESRFVQTFEPAGYVVFDVTLEPKPENISPDLEAFWGGYDLQFKLISRARYDELGGRLDAIRREAIPSRPGGKARFEIDISRHECCVGKQTVEIDRFTVYVYTPAMVVCEKIRAICQQAPAYASFVRKHQAPRTRDFFDIHEVVNRFNINLATRENQELLRKMFRAKRVPLELLLKITEQREFHRQGWDALRDTVDPAVRLRRFDFYFDYVLNLCQELAQGMRLRPFGT
jgi:predicted nucleotidyltransferase component of viral defense system